MTSKHQLPKWRLIKCRRSKSIWIHSSL